MDNEIKINDILHELELPQEFEFIRATITPNKLTGDNMPVYACEKDIIFREKKNGESTKQTITFNLILCESQQKDIVRIKNINSGNKRQEGKKFLLDCLPYLNELLFNMNLFFKKKIIEKINNEIPESLVYRTDLNHVHIPLEGKLNLDDNEIQRLVNNVNDRGLKNLFVESSLASLNNFINEFKKLMEKDNVKEREFQDLMYRNPNILTLIFGTDSSEKVEKEAPISEGQENRIDLLIGENLIIELKRPDTELFNRKNGRNNLSGLSSKLISGVTQLHLYIVKKNREKNLQDKFFSNGVLIIGSDKQFKRDEDYMAWKFFRESYKFQIITYDDFLNSLLKLKINLEMLKKKEENYDK